MGIYVSGISMPTSCEGCFESPLLYVEPHGRLIDVDKLWTYCRHAMEYQKLDGTTEHVEFFFAADVADAQIVIPADPPQDNRPLLFSKKVVDFKERAKLCCKNCAYNYSNSIPDPLCLDDYEEGEDIVCIYFNTDGLEPDDYCSKGKLADSVKHEEAPP